jgi:hypothetical protein
MMIVPVKEISPALDWIHKVNADDVYDVLIEEVRALPLLRLTFAHFWVSHEYEYTFEGALGPHGKMWRGRSWRIEGKDKAPFLHVNCYGELKNEERMAVIEKVNQKFLTILISAGLRNS